MANKPIISIDVQDDAFKRFMELFKEYEERVGELPDEWKKVDEAMNGAGKRFARSAGNTGSILAGMAAATATIAESIHEAAKAQQRFEQSTVRAHRSMTKLGAATKGFAGSVFSISRALLKWGGISSLLGAVGGGFGISDIASTALTRQRTARGLGMTSGQSSTFNTYFNQFGSAESIAANVANARNDVSKRWMFARLGIGPQELATDSNFQLNQLVVERIQRLVKSFPRASWANLAQANGLTNFADLQTLRLLRNTSTGRVEAAAAGASASVGALGFSPRVAREWVDLEIQIRKAETQIGTSLITGLHQLAPELQVITKDVADWIQAFANSGQAQKLMGEVTAGLKSFADYVGSKQFHDQLVEFGDDIALASRKIVAGLRFLGLIPEASATFESLEKASTTPGQKMPLHGVNTAHFREHMARSPALQAKAKAAMEAASAKYNIPEGMLWSLSGVESSHGLHQIGPQTKYGRALGWFQFLPSTATDLHINPLQVTGPHGSAMGAAHYLRILKDHYGTWEKAIAAYDWGQGKLDGALAAAKKSGKDWHTYLPTETKGEINRVLVPWLVNKKMAAAAPPSGQLPSHVESVLTSLRLQGSKSVHINVTNSTPSRVAIQAQAAAY